MDAAKCSTSWSGPVTRNPVSDRSISDTGISVKGSTVMDQMVSPGEPGKDFLVCFACIVNDVLGKLGAGAGFYPSLNWSASP